MIPNNQSQINQTKLHQQQQLLAKLKSQEAKLAQYVAEFKQALQRKSQKQKQDNKLKSKQQQQKLQKQLQKQVQNARTMLKNYQHQLKIIQKKSRANKYTSDDLLQLQQQLHTKQIEQRQLQQEIKDLKLVKRKQQKLIQKKEQHEQNGQKLAKLVEEVRKQRDLLDGLKGKTSKKQQFLAKKKSEIDQLTTKYIQKCRQTGQAVASFQDFKQRRKQKRRQQASGQKQRSIRKTPLTVKQMINGSQFYSADSLQPTDRNLQQLRSKKQVAEGSLKLAKKKDEKEIQELRGRVDKLKEQHSLLQQKLSQKLKQKQGLGQMYMTRPKDKSKHQVKLNKSHNTSSNAVVKLQPINK